MGRRSGTTLAERLVAAKRRIAELETARVRAEPLFAVTRALGNTLTLGDTLEAILEQLQKVVPHDSRSVRQVAGNEMVIVGGHGFPNLDELLRKRLDRRGPDDPAGEVVATRGAAIVRNRMNRKLGAKVLARLDYAVTLANDGLQAVEAARAAEFDVILMDIEMPGLAGIAACRAIKAGEAAGKPRIVALTANAIVGDREKYLASGFDSHLSKPLNVGEFRQQLIRAHAVRNPSRG